MGDKADLQAPEMEAEAKSGGRRLLLIVVFFVILLGVIGVIAMKMLGGGGQDDYIAAPLTQMDKPGYMYKFPAPFTGNLAAPDNDYIYSANVTVEIKTLGDSSESEALKEMGIETEDKHNKMPYIVKIIREEISSKSRMEITSSTNRERIANTIKNNINNILENAQIHEVFLEVFVN
ncbi:MAG: flagellar basal body-associated FliL family protein [Candidatus Omnitrophica bacterium]|nr:flagellar basal body-associated FliL family protein [Candidatus Omnitrophota bacterium]